MFSRESPGGIRNVSLLVFYFILFLNISPFRVSTATGLVFTIGPCHVTRDDRPDSLYK